MTPHPAFDAVLRETLAEVEAAEAIDAEDARQAQDGIERLRLDAAHLVTATSGGRWMTGAALQFASEPSDAPDVQPTLDIRFPPLRPRREAPVEVAAPQDGGASVPQRHGRRVPDNGKQVA
jgi:hypothetical protein